MYYRVPKDDPTDETEILSMRDDFITAHTSGATRIVLELFMALDFIFEKNECDGADIGCEIIQPIVNAIKLIEKNMDKLEETNNGDKRPRLQGSVDTEGSVVGQAAECIGEGHTG